MYIINVTGGNEGLLMATPTQQSDVLKKDNDTLQEVNLPNQMELKKVDSPYVLEDWVKSLKLSLEEQSENIESPSIILGRYGLKNAQEVIAFLKSPAGETTINEMAADVAHKKAIKEQAQIDALRHAMLIKLLTALMILWFAEEKAEAAVKLRDFIQEQNKEILNHELNKTKTNETELKVSEFKEIISTYDKAIERLEKKVEANEDEQIQLEKELAELNEQVMLIDKKYDEYDSGLLALENSSIDYDKMSEAELQHAIKQLDDKMIEMTNSITKLLDANNEIEAKALLNTQIALNLQAATLLDLKDVRESKKYYADEEGHKVDSFKDACFILFKGLNADHDQKIIRIDNKLYLLKPGQSWDKIKDSEELKQEASLNYDRLKQQCMSVRKVVVHHKNFEVTVNQAQIGDTNKKLAHNAAEKIVLQNQMNLMQSARAGAEFVLQNPSLGLRVPEQTPTMVASQGIATAASVSASLFYKERISELRQSKNITYENLMDLANKSPGNNKKAVEYLTQEFTKLSRAAAIPQVTMQMLLKGLERFGVSIDKEKDKPADEVSYQSPNPLKIEPDKF